MSDKTTVTRIKLPLSNAYLVHGKRPVLIDSGAPGDAGRILRALRAAGVDPVELSLILLTHGHSDHVGAANELSDASGAPVAIHAADSAMALSGRNILGTLNGREARLVAAFADKPFAPVRGDLVIAGGVDLRAFGVPGEVFSTPGHTAGSLSVLLDNGDVIVGDLLMGGRLGGAYRPRQPRLHYFVEDFGDLAASMGAVLARRPVRLLVGHGGPLDSGDVSRWWRDEGRREVDRKRVLQTLAPEPVR